jgi:predicted acylesterase/phospholipase RssA
LKKFLFLVVISVIFVQSFATKIGLVLSGGAARGLAHIGVIEKLIELGIEPDIIVGTSMGAIVGAAYASGFNTEQMLALVRIFIEDGALESLVELSGATERGGIVPHEKIDEYFRTFFGNTKIEDLKLTYACVVYDMVSKKEVVLKSGDLVDAITASSAFPGVFEPVKINDMVLIDGGIKNNIPIDVAKNLGADLIIVSDVSQKNFSYLPRWYIESVGTIEETVRNFLKFIPEREKLPNLLGVLLESIENKTDDYGLNLLGLPDYAGADVVIRPYPDDKDKYLWDFYEYDLLYFYGVIATEREKKVLLEVVKNEER